jgi:hypothetical protein
VAHQRTRAIVPTPPSRVASADMAVDVVHIGETGRKLRAADALSLLGIRRHCMNFATFRILEIAERVSNHSNTDFGSARVSIEGRGSPAILASKARKR